MFARVKKQRYLKSEVLKQLGPLISLPRIMSLGQSQLRHLYEARNRHRLLYPHTNSTTVKKVVSVKTQTLEHKRRRLLSIIAISLLMD